MLEKRQKQIIMTRVGTIGSIVYRLSPAMVERAVLLAQKSQLGIFKRFS